MLDLDASFKTAQEIISVARNNIANIRSEEDTKIQIINRLLCEALGWLTSDLSAETHHENGFSDYILSIRKTPALLIEAKRIGLLEIGTSEKDKIRHLKISGVGLKKVEQGIDQAFSYAAPNGLNLTILTDGICWVFFKTFVSGANYKSKEAIVFPSFEAIENNYPTFYELLAKENFEKKLYNSIFDKVHEHRVALTKELIPALSENQIHISRKSDIAFDLEKVFANFFSRLTGDSDRDLLIECFVETKESRIADFSLEKMTANVLGNIAPSDKEVGHEIAKLIQTNVETEAISDNIETNSESGQTVFIVGPTGAGKTTFLERFFQKTLSRVIRKRCAVIKVNCLDASGREDTVLQWLTEELITSMEREIYANGTPTYDQLRGLYYSEYQRRRTGVDAHLYKRSTQEFREKFGEFLDREVERDREGYLKRILIHIVTSNKLPIFVIDNTDEFSAEYKKNLFQFVQALRRHVNHCLVILPVTDKSAWSFSKTDIFGIYKSRSFFLPTPSPREVFRKRIDFIKQKTLEDSDGTHQAGKQYFSSRGIKVSIADINSFARILEDVFVEHDYTAKTIGELTNYNIRRTLLLSQRIITSSVFNIDDLIKSYITSKFVAPNFTKFMDALIKGDYEAFRVGDNPEIYPIFQCDNEIQHSPLLQLRILMLLDATRKIGNNIDERHLNSQSIINYFDAMGCTEIAVDKALLSLLQSGLIEPYDTSAQHLSPDQRLAISYRGTAHFRLAMHNSVYFYQMALTSGITNEDVALQIRDSYRSQLPIGQKVLKVRQIFAEYLIHEDRNYVSQDLKAEQFNIQNDLVEAIDKFRHSADHDKNDAAAVLGDEFEEGFASSSVIAVVKWFDPTKGFGFAEVDEFGVDVFLHAEQLKEVNLEIVSDGDELLCDIARNAKGLHITKIYMVQLDDSKVEICDCKIARIFFDRGYGFVNIIGREQSASFQLSLFANEQKESVTEGLVFSAELIPYKNGESLRVRRVLSIPPV